MTPSTQKFLVCANERKIPTKSEKAWRRWALEINHNFVVDIVKMNYIWDDQAMKSVRQLEVMVKLREEVRVEDEDLGVTAMTTVGSKMKV